MTPIPTPTTHAPKKDFARILAQTAQTLVADLMAGQPIHKERLIEAIKSVEEEQGSALDYTLRNLFDMAELAVVLFLRRVGPGLLNSNLPPERVLAQLQKLEQLEPSQTYRSEDQIRLQQFSTPAPLMYLAWLAAQIESGDSILEPSAGNGILTSLIDVTSTDLILNEIEDIRHTLLSAAYPDSRIYQKDAARINDYLAGEHPTVVLMNPPFSRELTRTGKRLRTDLRHTSKALAMLPENGRLVAITGANSLFTTEAWQTLHNRDDHRIVLSLALDGNVYKRHGTSFEVRLTVIDKTTESLPTLPVCHTDERITLDEALPLVIECAKRLPVIGNTSTITRRVASPPGKNKTGQQTLLNDTPGPTRKWENESGWEEIAHHVNDITKDTHKTIAGNFAPWLPTVVTVEGSASHPTPLMQTTAMAAVTHPPVDYRPRCPKGTVEKGLLSDAQLESVVLAGAAHNRLLAHAVRINSDWLDTRYEADENSDSISTDTTLWSRPIKPRCGWFLGDDTGTGKGRQAAAIIMDNFFRGRTRAVWLSESDKLIEDARRDWTALGGKDTDIVSINKWKLGEPITLGEGIVFSTYASLRTARPNKTPRLNTLVNWLAGEEIEAKRHRFEGVIAFDECHALANALSNESESGFGKTKASLQGQCGLMLQNALPNARVIYVSATGANRLESLAYAVRLGLWGDKNTGFRTRDEFLTSLKAGGIAAMEIIARDLKSLGLYQARVMSYDGVKIDTLVHTLTAEQLNVYNSYADAFKIIHNNLQQALLATGITDPSANKTHGQAKSAAVSAFESAKQRFFSQLLTSMKCPSLCRAIEEDLASNQSVVIQVVTTGEAMLERRLAAIPPAEYNDITIDLTPREYIIEYLKSAFPIYVYETCQDEEGKDIIKQVFDENNEPVISQDALKMRDGLIEELYFLPPTPNALDLLIWRFGHEEIAEITGRSRRVVKITDSDGERLVLKHRPASSNLAEAADFMNGQKRILIFSGAGGTGRSYHADRHVKNTQVRRHYLLEAGWRAEKAIQGLGRTHRTNQVQPPAFIPVTTDVKGERRFISSIAKRLDSLGAITRGQRNAQSQRSGNSRTALFNERDNFESAYARNGLRSLINRIYRGEQEGWRIGDLEDVTGLRLTRNDGALVENLPPMSRFLNRLLALRIEDQNELFGYLETIIDNSIEHAKLVGAHDKGIEYITGLSLEILSEQEIYRHRSSDTATRLVELKQTERASILNADDADARARFIRREHPHQTWQVVNKKTGYAALLYPGPARTDEDGSVLRDFILLRPNSRTYLDSQETHLIQFNQSDKWELCESEDQWREAWQRHCGEINDITTRRLWLITGLMLPIWTDLPDDNIKVYRAITDDQTHLIGRVFNDIQAKRILSHFGKEDKIKLDPRAVIAELKSGAEIKLDNTFTLKQRFIAGERRIVIKETTLQKTDIDELKSRGCRVEVIAHRPVVVAPAKLNDLLKHYDLSLST